MKELCAELYEKTNAITEEEKKNFRWENGETVHKKEKVKESEVATNGINKGLNIMCTNVD